MSENIVVSNTQNKEERYRELYPQLKSLLEGEADLTANMANTAAALKEVFGWWWVGFYVVQGSELVLAPFQGPVACTRIGYGKGVCGTAWKEQRAILVPDVNAFPGHIACSSASVSEIVVPLFDGNNDVFAVLDVDSEQYGVLDEIDVEYLSQLASLLKKRKSDSNCFRNHSFAIIRLASKN